MREFRLFKNQSGAFEVVPIGWSFLALFLNLFWAMQIGLFLRFLRYFMPALIVMAIGAFLLEVQNLEAVGTVCMLAGVVYGNGFVFYFSVVANDWRVEQLENKGYQQIARIRGRSAQQALSEWARSSQAESVLGTF